MWSMSADDMVTQGLQSSPLVWTLEGRLTFDEGLLLLDSELEGGLTFDEGLLLLDSELEGGLTFGFDGAGAAASSTAAAASSTAASSTAAAASSTAAAASSTAAAASSTAASSTAAAASSTGAAAAASSTAASSTAAIPPVPPAVLGKRSLEPSQRNFEDSKRMRQLWENVRLIKNPELKEIAMAARRQIATKFNNVYTTNLSLWMTPILNSMATVREGKRVKAVQVVRSSNNSIVVRPTINNPTEEEYHFSNSAWVSGDKVLHF